MRLPIKPRPKSLAISHWAEVEPFLENTRAVLIHRPRYVSVHQISKKYAPHLAVETWCGTTYTGTKKFTFLDRIPKGRLLCERCEVNAFAHEQPSAESIMKKHVHLGRVIAQQTCCHTVKEHP